MINDSEENNEFRRPRKRTLSAASVKSVVSSWESSCTARPLTTPNSQTIGAKNKGDQESAPLMPKNIPNNTSATPVRECKPTVTLIEVKDEKDLVKPSKKLDYTGDLKVNDQKDKNSSKNQTGINSILKMPSQDRNKLTVPGGKVNTTKTSSTTHSLPPLPQMVTWKDISDQTKQQPINNCPTDKTKSKDASNNSQISQSIVKTTGSNSLTNSNNQSHVERSPSFQATTRHTRQLSGSNKITSQPDLTNYLHGQIYRPRSQTCLEVHQSPMTNSSCIMHPMACLPATIMNNGNSPVLSKSMQKPSSIPPRTIHPSLRSHFAIEKSVPTVNPPTGKAGGGKYQHYQPITTPLMHKSDANKQSYQHKHQQQFGLDGKVQNKRIETDIM